MSERTASERFVIGKGMIGRVAADRRAVREPRGRPGAVPAWIAEEEGFRSFAHVPLSIGPRLFGVLTVGDERPGVVDDALLARMVAFGRFAAG